MKINEIENNIENFRKYMTIYYSKFTGKIQTYQTGIADMSAFDEIDESFRMIWDYTIVPKDDYVMMNMEEFMIVDNEIKELPPEMVKKPKYERATKDEMSKIKPTKKVEIIKPEVAPVVVAPVEKEVKEVE